MKNVKIAISTFACLVSLLMFWQPAIAQNLEGNSLTTSGEIEVLTLGVFHFNFPNLDAKKYDKEEQIDVLSPEFQKEIEAIANRLAEFKPNVVVIERPVSKQSQIDSLYHEYLAGNHQLERSETQQLGFRIASKCNAVVFCADAWGNTFSEVKELIGNSESAEYKRFEETFSHNIDSTLYFNDRTIFQEQGILAELKKINSRESIRKHMGNYLIGHFKFEALPGDYLGADFESGRWIDRNIRIFRNIQRIPKSQNQRILVIFGAGHMSLLNYLFECSPEYKLLDVNDFLK